jgi:ATP-binding cassette, subfamily A (ABC1), member 3
VCSLCRIVFDNAEYWQDVFCARRRTAPTVDVSAPACGTVCTSLWRGWKLALPKPLCCVPEALTTAESLSLSYPLEPADGHMNAVEAAGKVIKIQGLRKEFKNRMDASAAQVAVNNVDLTMYEGQIFVLLGHNGAGKSTTVSMLTGLLQPTAGRCVCRDAVLSRAKIDQSACVCVCVSYRDSISVYGKQVPAELDAIRNEVGLGVCPQHDVLYPDLTVKEHLEFFAGIKGVPRKDVAKVVQDSIDTIGLTEKVWWGVRGGFRLIFTGL